jgi:hypothetical protein
MIWAFIESFFFFQPIKVIIVYIWKLRMARKYVSVMCDIRDSPKSWSHGLIISPHFLTQELTYDEVIVKTRFRLIWMCGRTSSIKIWPLNYQVHPMRIYEMFHLPVDSKESGAPASAGNPKQPVRPDPNSGSESEGTAHAGSDSEGESGQKADSNSNNNKSDKPVKEKHVAFKDVEGESNDDNDKSIPSKSSKTKVPEIVRSSYAKLKGKPAKKYDNFGNPI